MMGFCFHPLAGRVPTSGVLSSATQVRHGATLGISNTDKTVDDDLTSRDVQCAAGISTSDHLVALPRGHDHQPLLFSVLTCDF